jgi:hypothetical protein
LTKGVDDSALLLLIEGLSIDLPDRVGIIRLLVSYLNHDHDSTGCFK